MGRDRQDQDLPSDGEDRDRKAEESGDKSDEVPPPGTDPLHEGP
jgi:hypothetical protein